MESNNTPREPLVETWNSEHGHLSSFLYLPDYPIDASDYMDPYEDLSEELVEQQAADEVYADYMQTDGQEEGIEL